MELLAILAGILYVGAGLGLWGLTQSYLLNSDWDKQVKKQTEPQTDKESQAQQKKELLTWRRLLWPIALIGLVGSVIIGVWPITESYASAMTETKEFTREEVLNSTALGLWPRTLFGLIGFIVGTGLYLGPVALKEINYRFDKSLNKSR